MSAELDERRVLRHSSWVSHVHQPKECPHEPVRAILPQPSLLGLRAQGRRARRDLHSKKEQRHRCKRCRRTFSQTKGTALYRMHKPHELMPTVVSLLAYGCPVHAIVVAFGLDERTVARWQREAGE